MIYSCDFGEQFQLSIGYIQIMTWPAAARTDADSDGVLS